jgi:cobalt-zinc-cadmium efflux system protein
MSSSHRPHDHHAHDHRHAQREGERIGFAFWLNFCFTVVELIGGILTNSIAILSNAIHDFGDTLAIGFGWLSSRLAQRSPDAAYTYGYRRLSLLSALVIGLTLAIGSIVIIVNALPRLWRPQAPHVGGMFALALIGIAANGIAALRLYGGHTQNEKILSWHLLEDVLGWIAVLLASIVIHFTGWNIIDPLLSIGFTLFILFNVVRNLRDTLRLFLQKSPDRELTENIRAALNGLEGVADTHHLHLWSLDGQHHVLTAHVALKQAISAAQQLLLKEKIHALLKPYGLSHTTIEFEFPAEVCRDH